MEKIKKKRIVLEVRQELHKEVKVASAIRNISISLLIHRAIYQYLRKEERDNLK
jgi:hypothetical protein